MSWSDTETYREPTKWYDEEFRKLRKELGAAFNVAGALKASVTVSTAEILTLHSTPKELVPAPGAGYYNQLVAVTARAIFGTTALNDASAQGNLRIKTAGGVSLAIQEADGFVDLTTGTEVRSVRPDAPAATQDVTPANEALQLDNDGAAFTDPGSADTTLSLDVYYRVLPL